jgi:hypothetical protein
MLDYLNRVSIFDHSTAALVLILAANWAFTLIHVLQEWKGENAPLWRVFGAIVGVWVSNRWGFALFTLGLTAILWAVGLVAITGWPLADALHPNPGVVALGALIGARVGDSVISHWVLYARGYRPNPGLSSTVLYSIEAVFILITFRAGLSSAPGHALIGLVFGVLAFLAVLPGLWLFRVFPSLRRKPWVRWTPLPDWARE